MAKKAAMGGEKSESVKSSSMGSMGSMGTSGSAKAGLSAAAPFNGTTRSQGSSPAKQITHEMIAKRAYEIFISGKGGSQDDNWSRAERELKSGR